MKLTSRFSSRLLLPFALALGLAPVAASAQTTPTGTVITTVPYTISTSGRYVVGNNLIDASGGNVAITINAANVVLDLNGYFVSGGGTDNFVILVNGKSGVTIKNGTVARAGVGIYYGNVSMRDETLDHVTVTNCTQAGVEFDAAAEVGVISNCVFSNIGDFALYLSGGWRVENSVVDTSASVTTTYGIYSAGDDLLIGNTISNCANGIYYASTDATVAGKFLNNLLYNCATPFTNGTNATGNN